MDKWTDTMHMMTTFTQAVVWSPEMKRKINEKAIAQAKGRSVTLKRRICQLQILTTDDDGTYMYKLE